MTDRASNSSRCISRCTLVSENDEKYHLECYEDRSASCKFCKTYYHYENSKSPYCPMCKDCRLVAEGLTTTYTHDGYCSDSECETYEEEDVKNLNIRIVPGSRPFNIINRIRSLQKYTKYTILEMFQDFYVLNEDNNNIYMGEYGGDSMYCGYSKTGHQHEIWAEVSKLVKIDGYIPNDNEILCDFPCNRDEMYKRSNHAYNILLPNPEMRNKIPKVYAIILRTFFMCLNRNNLFLQKDLKKYIASIIISEFD